MKTKIFALLLAGAVLLSACGGLPSLGIGAGNNTKEMELQEIKPEPTEAVLPDDTFFRDELEKDINEDWGLKVVSGLEKQLILTQVNGKFRMQTLPPNDVNFTFLNKKHTYKDVVVQAEVENSGQLDNAFSLICRATEAGWYEFRISSDGYYELLRFDAYKKAEGKNAYTNFVEKRTGSTLIKGGLDKNTFSLSCVGNLITAFVNGEQLYWQKRPLAIEDDTYGEGTIGFGFLGYGKVLDATFNWVEAVKP
ncbi:MAG: hypothetical protein MUO42_05240 [Anaerolineaceae bacterium]|nr:hypothetical protein [Anaerolineaceae bacterium]